MRKPEVASSTVGHSQSLLSQLQEGTMQSLSHRPSPSMEVVHPVLHWKSVCGGTNVARGEGWEAGAGALEVLMGSLIGLVAGHA